MDQRLPDDRLGWAEKTFLSPIPTKQEKNIAQWWKKNLEKVSDTCDKIKTVQFAIIEYEK